MQPLLYYTKAYIGGIDMKAIKSLILTTVLSVSIGITCCAQPLLSRSRFLELYTKEEFIMEYGEEVYKMNTPKAVLPAVKKPVQTTVSEKAEQSLIKGTKLQFSALFQK